MLSSSTARLKARPERQPLGKITSAGVARLPLGRQQALLYVPAAVPARQIPLVVMLHGSGADKMQGIELLSAMAEQHGFLLLAPKANQHTWDLLLGTYGPDVAGIDAALAVIFRQYDIDPAHIAIGGFSDGASYALSLGLSNGTLFSHIIAFSPCFSAPAQLEGKPSVFISHGMQDSVLPIERCSRRIVPQLQRSGYDVTYHEFSGPHGVPQNVRQEAARWFMTPGMPLAKAL